MSTTCKHCKNALNHSNAHLIAASTGTFGIIRFVHTVRRASGNAACSRLQLASSVACLRKRRPSNLDKCESTCDTFRSPGAHGRQRDNKQLCSPCRSEPRDRYCECDMVAAKRYAVYNVQHELVVRVPSLASPSPHLPMYCTQNAACRKCWKIQLTGSICYRLADERGSNQSLHSFGRKDCQTSTIHSIVVA